MLFYITIFITSFMLTWLYRYIAKRKSILDSPSERSSHSVPTPRGGGIAIAITWFLTITYLFIKKEIETELFYALLFGIPISAIGLIDDIKSISPKLRLFIQIIAASGAVITLGGLQRVDIGFTFLSTPYVLSIFAIIGIVWFINLFNFVDGIDGYVSSEVIFAGIGSLILFQTELPVILSVITLGFLIWNWQPAKIFMGDIGSTLLGFTFGVFAVHFQNAGDCSLIFFLMLTSLIWFDASITLFRRWRNGEKLSSAHKKHAYQRIVQYGFSHQKTVILGLFINLVIFALVFLAIEFPGHSLLFLFINMIFLYFILKMIDKRFPFQKN